MSNAASFTPRYTYQDYLQWEGDWELWFGTAVAMTPSPFGPHERIVSELAGQLRNELKAKCPDCRVYAGLDWLAAEDTVVRPDVMVVCGEQPERHLERPPVLAAEVLSPSTAERDREYKSALYAQFGVPHYLILDPKAATFERFELASGEYRVAEPANSELQLADDCEVSLDIGELFR
jgi:Uma2 family endonuclease